MKLSEINPTPLYDVKVPSTQRAVKFRPFLVKEERALLAAYESEDTKVMLNTLTMVVANCLTPSQKNLTTFDIEYLFLQIRSKSVGEQTTLNFTCGGCSAQTPFNIDIRRAEVVGLDKDTLVTLSDDLTIKMRYPSIEEVISLEDTQDANETLRKILLSTMETIFVGSESLDVKDESPEEIMSFADRLTARQYKQLEEFILSTPTVQLNVKWTCPKCKHHNEITLKGINSFF
jgi:hypothetical protein